MKKQLGALTAGAALAFGLTLPAGTAAVAPSPEEPTFVTNPTPDTSGHWADLGPEGCDGMLEATTGECLPANDPETDWERCAVLNAETLECLEEAPPADEPYDPIMTTPGAHVPGEAFHGEPAVPADAARAEWEKNHPGEALPVMPPLGNDGAPAEPAAPAHGCQP